MPPPLISSLLSIFTPSSPTPPLALDPSIRDWVVLPLLVLMLLTGLMRQYLGSLLKSSKKINAMDASNRKALSRVSRLRGVGGFISKGAFEQRKAFYTAEKGGLKLGNADSILSDPKAEKPKSIEGGDKDAPSAPPAAPAMNPASAMEGMLQNGSFMVQNMLLMNLISHFFSGFILLKVPFPLTKGFKQMFQRGIMIGELDTSYVSSLSWYFLLMFGLRSVFKLIIGETSQDDISSMILQQDLGNVSGAVPPPLDVNVVGKTERENLEIARYRGVITGAEKRLLKKRYPGSEKNVNSIGNGNGGQANGGGRKKKNRGDDIFGELDSSVAETKKGK